MDAHSNFAYSTVATAPSPATSGTSLVVTAGQGALFPAAPFNAVIWPTGAQPLSTNAEVVRVTAIATDTFTITRTQEGSSARTVVVGDQIAANITAKVLTDIEAIDTTTVHIAGTETVTGAKSFSSPILLPDGSSAAPALSFISDPDTGIKSNGANALAIVLGAQPYITIDATANVAINGQFLAWGGGAATPGLGFNSDSNTGLRSGGADILTLLTGGVDALSIDATQVVKVGSRVVGQDALASIVAATGAIANTETVVTSATIPANLMKAGTTFRIVASGVGTASTSTAGSTWRIRIGTTTLTGNIAASLTGTSASGSNIPFSVTALVTVRTAGASGSALGSIVYNSNAATGNLNTTIAVGQVTATVAVDTTAQKLVELTYISGVSTTTSTYHNAVIEMVKA